MSNRFKLIIVAIISFSLGVVAISFFKNKDSQTEHSISYTTRKPFLVKVKESSNKIIHTFSKPAAEKSQMATVNPTEKSGKVKDNLYEELNKKFKRISPDTKELRGIRNNDYLKNRLDYMFMEKELWYKTSFEDGFSQSKTTLFFKFLQCNKTPQRGIELNKTCYTFEIFNFKNDKWSQANISSQVIGLVWYNDIPYAHIDLTELGDFSKDTNVFYAVVPIPNEPQPMQYLKYESGKYNWIEGKEITWTLTSQKEINKFSDWVDGHNVKHGEQPE